MFLANTIPANDIIDVKNAITEVISLRLRSAQNPFEGGLEVEEPSGELTLGGRVLVKVSLGELAVDGEALEEVSLEEIALDEEVTLGKDFDFVATNLLPANTTIEMRNIQTNKLLIFTAFPSSTTLTTGKGYHKSFNRSNFRLNQSTSKHSADNA